MLWVATPTVLCMCCCVPEGVLVGASTASRGNHPEDPLPLLLVSCVSYPLGSCSVVMSGSWFVACHRITWTPSLVCLGPCDLGLVPCSACVPASPSRCMIRSGV